MSRGIGKLDLLGLNSFGQNPGMSPIIGAGIGGGIAGVSTMILRHTGATRHPELFGFLGGALASTAMYAMKSTRHAAIGGFVGTALATGFALLERYLFGNLLAPAPVVDAGVKGLGIPDIRALNGLGIPSMRSLNGLGIPMISDRSAPAGAIPGVAGTQLGAPGVPPISLLGPGTPQGMSLLGMGGPAVHGLSSSYGATLLGGGR